MKESSISYASTSEYERFLAMTPQELAHFSVASLNIEVRVAKDNLAMFREIGVNPGGIVAWLENLQQALALKSEATRGEAWYGSRDPMAKARGLSLNPKV